MSDGPGAPKLDAPPPTPRWVKVLGILVLAALAVAVIVVLLSDGQHGPSIHTSMHAHSTQESMSFGPGMHHPGHDEAGLRGSRTG